MSQKGTLEDKVVLAIGGDHNILKTIENDLDMCIVDMTYDYAEASQFLSNFNYDVVVLDVIGIKGFELLKIATSKGFPTVILTANGSARDVLNKSKKLGAIALLPKEKIHELVELLEDVISGRGRSVYLIKTGEDA